MKQTIALVDDDRNILTSVSMALGAEGFEVRTFTDGASALQGLTSNPVNLAVLDIKMPRMDGMELLKKLRTNSNMPIIFLTSKDDEVDEVLVVFPPGPVLDVGAVLVAVVLGPFNEAWNLLFKPAK